MIKIAKLIGIFTFVTVCLLVLLTMTGGKNQKLSPEDEDKLYIALHQEIVQSWNDASDWDGTLYVGLNDRLRQNFKGLSYYSIKLLRDQNNELAVECLYNVMTREMGAADGRPERIRSYFDGMENILTLSPELGLDPRLHQLRSRYNLYDDVLSFTHSNFDLQPHFDGKEHWNDVDAYCHRIEQRCAHLTGDSLFQFMAQQDTIIRSLQSVDTAIVGVRQRFYDRLGEELRASFDTIQNPTDEQTAAVQRVQKAYNEKRGPYGPNLDGMFARFQLRQITSPGFSFWDLFNW